MAIINIPNINDLEYLITEDDPFTSREQIVCAPNTVAWPAGTVLGKISLANPTSAVKASGANTGNGTFVVDATAPLQLYAEAGTYRARFTTLTNIEITNPTGRVIAEVPIGGATGNTATVNDQIKGAFTQGATPFAVGDGFDIAIAAGSGQYAPVDPNAVNGLQTFAGILMFSLPISATVTRTGANVRKCSVNGNKLFYINTLSSPQKAAIEADASTGTRGFTIVRY